MHVLGIDGGGTKTLLALCDGHGKILGNITLPAFSLDYGEESVLLMLTGGVTRLLEAAGLSPEPSQLSAVCYGVPGWGESKKTEAIMERVTKACFGDIPRFLCNDAQVAWAGSFAMAPGINVVAGTGAIAFGMDSRGETARCNGWGALSADEGSGYWLAKRMMQIFFKQADGRIETQGPLYRLVHEHFQTEDDFEIVEIVEAEYFPHRDKTASLQRVLLEAARAGDESAIGLYREAGLELAENIRAIQKKLIFDGPPNVSYSGGIFKVGSLVIESFSAGLLEGGCVLTEPIAPPWAGALMIALSLVDCDHAAAYGNLIKGATECHS